VRGRLSLLMENMLRFVDPLIYVVYVVLCICLNVETNMAEMTSVRHIAPRRPVHYSGPAFHSCIK